MKVEEIFFIISDSYSADLNACWRTCVAILYSYAVNTRLSEMIRRHWKCRRAGGELFVYKDQNSRGGSRCGPEKELLQTQRFSRMQIVHTRLRDNDGVDSGAPGGRGGL